MRKKIVGVLCILSMALMLALPIYSTAAEETIKLAVIDPLSGPFKDLGDRLLDGVVYAAKVINESGGLLGKKVEVIPTDSEVKPDVATRKAQALIMKDGVKFFCGGVGSSVAAAMSKLAERENVLLFGYGWQAPSLTGEKCNKNFFRVCGNSDQLTPAYAEAAVKKGYKRLATINPDYSAGHEAVAAFKKKLAEISPETKIVLELYPPLGTKDYGPYISQIIASKADAIFTLLYGNDMILLLKQGHSMGMKQNLLYYFLTDDSTIKSLGDAENSIKVGDSSVEWYSITIPTKKNQEFVAKFYKDKGYYPTYARGYSYLATMFWAEAVKKAGTTDVDAVIKAWEGLQYDGPAGVWKMRACDHQLQFPYWFVEIVKENKFFKHPYVGPAKMISAENLIIPCEKTGCKMK